MYTTNTIISKHQGYYSVGDEVFTCGKKSRMVVCFVDAAFKPATSLITDPHHTRCLDISKILQKLIYILPVKIFDKRHINKALAEVTGEKVNWRAGYGLEIPCVYRLYGPKAYVG